jgi:hypothetical protein
VVVLTTAPVQTDSALTFGRLPAQAVAVDRPDGRHLLLREPHGNRQLWVVGDLEPTVPMAAVIPFDAYVPQRLEAALHLWQQLMGSTPSPVAPLTNQQRRRLILMLRALDGWLERASYRDLAATLLDPGVRAQPRRDWLTSAARAQIIRIVKDAVHRMKGGYRDLLRGK